ncbi:hypothetical protein Pcinc_012686 [Petrolisthes cinctipes]|uniref:Uncharacterized protein n=1 Tax=Petrolisthes cinctipes TaxID=88211 RepID=A0AAE1G0G4_PETCI|nr:hypothetical protein Pcinc_012686 [Petrolisthes cinctipes]
MRRTEQTQSVGPCRREIAPRPAGPLATTRVTTNLNLILVKFGDNQISCHFWYLCLCGDDSEDPDDVMMESEVSDTHQLSRPDRCQLSDNTFHSLVFIKYNKNLKL